MGNQLSNESNSGEKPTGTFGKRYALGLTKMELDKRCQPSGLYPSCQWEDKAVRRLIGDGRLAARLQGDESRQTIDDLECPICFLQYSQINVTQCCKAYMCTECFLQVRPQKEKLCSCPFCNNPKLFVTVAKKLDAEQLQERQADEQRAIAHQIQKQNIHDAEQFGATLENRIRSQSGSGDADMLIRQHSMTEEDRRAIEAEMRAQHAHPLALQMQAEAEERRLLNEREYYRANSGRTREAALLRTARMEGLGITGTSFRSREGRNGRGSGSSRRNWNDIVSSFERGGGDQVNSLDDLVVLEAAILLSMEEEARREGNSGTTIENRTFNAPQHAREGFPLVQQYLNGRSNSNRRIAGTGFQILSEEEQVAMAIAISMQEASGSDGSQDDTRNTDVSDDALGDGEETIEFSEQTTAFTDLEETDQDRTSAAVAPRSGAAEHHGNSGLKLPVVPFDDSDQKRPAADFGGGDRKLPAVDLKKK